MRFLVIVGLLGACGGTPLAVGTAADAAVSEPDIAARLRAIPGITVEERARVGTARNFDLRFKLPVDHDAANRGHFQLRLRLVHVSNAAPVVVQLSGYALTSVPRVPEPAELLGANAVTIEHRFFGDSVPSPADWTLMTIRQTAADQHAVIAAFHQIYSGAFLSTGTSNGGTNALIHRRFYPNDVVGTIAYVAPISLGDADGRYAVFLDHVGDAACRRNLLRAQRTLLKRSDTLAPMLTDGGESYTKLSPMQAYEMGVVELPFAFWQLGTASHCASIPADGAPDAEWATFLQFTSPPAGNSDEGTAPLRPYMYQCAAELGYLVHPEYALRDLLRYPGLDRPINVLPDGASPPVFDPQAMIDLQHYIATAAERLMLVYGETDPWSAGAADLGGAADSVRFTVKGGNHRSSLAQLPPDEHARALARLRAWAGR
jgi:hypothetical protein